MVQPSSSSSWFPSELEAEGVHPAVEDFSSNLLDELQARTLNELSSGEREQILYEVHGVADVVEEEPSFVQCRLAELDEAILKLSRNTAYEQATLLAPDYVENVEFRLQFLRGDAFDVKTAATRMIAYFESKLELFGPEMLTKNVTLRDLDEESLNCLKTGFMQPLPIRDKSGRAIFCSCPALMGNQFFPVQNRLRAMWYAYHHSMVDDIEVQKRGIVWVIYVVQSGNADAQAAWKVPKLMKALPVRKGAIHVCFDVPKYRVLAYLGMLVGGQRGKTHVRLHFGTHVEVQYILATFGVLFYGEIFPIGPEGEPRLQHFSEMFKMWQQREDDFLASGVKEETTLIPGPKDVLLGRQKFVQEHCGNLRFRFTVETFREKYENNTTRLEKTEIASTIVRLIQESNGRFLKLDGAGWVEVDDMTAREKVSHTFRNKRDKAAAATNSNKSTTSAYKSKALPIQEKSSDKASMETEYRSITSRKSCDDRIDSKRLRSMPQALFL